ncbi:MAG: peroxiredoxin family protein, partial [Solirubrobacteraceae bacterium]
KGVPVGSRVPPFAVPLALGSLEGDANVATGPNQGEAGRVPACSVRRAGAMNVCDLYTGAPLVLALFIDAGSCPDVLKDIQALAPSFPRVHFAAVAVHTSHSSTRRLVRRLGLTFPVGVDRSGTLAALYGMASCPQVSFIAPGGIVVSPALLSNPSRSELRARIAALAASSRAPAAPAKAP